MQKNQPNYIYSGHFSCPIPAERYDAALHQKLNSKEHTVE